MKKCAYCGRDNPDEALACRECGQPDFEAGAQPSPNAPPEMTTCGRCGATTQIPGIFTSTRKSFRDSHETLCPDCRSKKTRSAHAKLLALKAGFGLVSLLLIWAFPKGGLGWAWFNFFLCDLAITLSLLPHELGHALTAQKLGFRVFKIVIGSGPNLFSVKIFGIPTDFHLFAFYGLTFTTPQRLAGFHAKKFAIVSAGLLVNAVIFGASLAGLGGSLAGLFSWEKRALPLEALVLANALILALNLWPRKTILPVGEVETDGLQLWRLLQRDPQMAHQSLRLRYVLEAMFYYAKNQLPEAVPWINQGLELYPDDFNLLNLRGIAALHSSHFEEAREIFLKAAEIKDITPLARYILRNNIAESDILMDKPELREEADRYSMEAMANLSWIPAIKGTRGAVLIALGKPAEGRALTLQTMQAHDAPSYKAQNACWLAMAEAQLGNLEMGRKYLAEARKLDPNCFLLDRTEQKLTTIANTVPSLTPPASPANS